MRFMLIVKASRDCEAGIMPSAELMERIGRFNQEMVNAGILRDGAGLLPSSKGARVKFTGRQTTVTDGPFPETKELIGGYWIIDVPSQAEAISWAKRVPPSAAQDAEIEVRQLFELENFRINPAIERERVFKKELANR